MADIHPKNDVPELPADENAQRRRAYAQPRLRHLGTVRQLTLGVSGGFAETGSTHKATRT